MVLNWCAGKANTVAEGSSASCVTSVNLYLLLTPGTNSGTVRQIVESRRTMSSNLPLRKLVLAAELLIK